MPYTQITDIYPHVHILATIPIIRILMLLMSLRIDKLVTNETRKTLVPKEYLIYNKITEFGI